MNKILEIFSVKTVISFIVAVFLVAFDRFLKISALVNQDWSINLISEILKFNFAKNYNIAFSLPLGGMLLLGLVIICLVLLLFYFSYLFFKKDFSKFNCVIFVFLGAISNLIDRLRYGYVIDYLDLKYFTIFNLADVMISGGVACLLLLIFLEERGIKKMGR